MIKDDCIAIGLIVWNGGKTIRYSLESILKQTHKNLVVYILDNQSTDSTHEIIRSLALNDARISFIIDSKKRDIASAQQFIFNEYLSKHKYCMFACDDDLYDAKYVELLFRRLLDLKVDMVYSNYHHMDMSGNFLPVRNRSIYNSHQTGLENALRFMWYRNCVPIFFGVYRTSSLEESMKYFRMFDSYGFNHENLMLTHYLLNNRVDFVDEDLFGYLTKERIALYQSRGYLFSKHGFRAILYSFVNQFNYTQQLLNLIKLQPNINHLHKNLLKLCAWASLIKYTIVVLLWVSIKRLLVSIKLNFD